MNEPAQEAGSLPMVPPHPPPRSGPPEDDGRAATLVDIPGRVKLRLTGGTVAGMLLMIVLVVGVLWKAGYTLAAPGSAQAGAITREEASKIVGEVVGKAVGDSERAAAEERRTERRAALKEHAANPHSGAARKEDAEAIQKEVQDVRLEQAALRTEIRGVRTDVARIEAAQERRFDRMFDKLDGIRKDVRKRR